MGRLFWGLNLIEKVLYKLSFLRVGPEEKVIEIRSRTRIALALAPLKMEGARGQAASGSEEDLAPHQLTTGRKPLALPPQVVGFRQQPERAWKSRPFPTAAR